jgi:geranylgeranyl pyrophosphate synthase
MNAIKHYQSHMKDLIMNDISSNANFPSEIRDATKYSLNSGKRLRPSIILSISGSSQIGDKLALFIEYVHNASLIVDDLPCMDNDSTRRGQDTVHKKYGEHVAQLVAFNLMISALKHSNDAITFTSTRDLQNILSEEINECLSFRGITGGQYMDLTIDKEIDILSERQQKDKILQLIRLKTGCLFGLSFQLGWYARCVNNVDAESLARIKEAGIAFGICYQIVDDLHDMESDLAKNGGYNNICRYFTRNEIIDAFSQYLGAFVSISHKYGIYTDLLGELYVYLLECFKRDLATSARLSS